MNKGPRGWDEASHSLSAKEPQGKYFTNGERDIITGARSLDPFDHLAPETDHTPNFTKGSRQSKSKYGEYHDGTGNEGLGL